MGIQVSLKKDLYIMNNNVKYERILDSFRFYTWQTMYNVQKLHLELTVEHSNMQSISDRMTKIKYK